MKDTQLRCPEPVISAEVSTWPMCDGKAKITHYKVFPGVDLYINDIHGNDVIPQNPEPVNAVEINFCTAGRYELFWAGSRILLQDGDFSINRENPAVKAENKYCFPTGKYQGVELLIFPEEAEKWCQTNLQAFPIPFSEIIDSTLGKRWVRFGKASLQCEHISRELYAVNPHSRLMWIRLKVLELMMALTDGIIEQEQEYIPSDRAQLARHLRDHMIGMDSGEFSLERIAKEHKLSVSQMQRIFKSVYGQTMYQYLKQYRLEEAADILQNSEASVEEIAFSAGYQSAGKFTEAFKNRYGITPLSYRRRKTMEYNGIK